MNNTCTVTINTMSSSGFCHVVIFERSARAVVARAPPEILDPSVFGANTKSMENGAFLFVSLLTPYKTQSHWREGTVDSDSEVTQRASLRISSSSALAVRTLRDGVLLRGQEVSSICDAVYYDSLHDVWAWELLAC